MNNPEELELHDALLKAMTTDFAARTAIVTLEYYASADAPKRSQLSLLFEGVTSISQIADLDRLQKNAFAGNVNYWRAGERETPSYLYLTDGCIAIAAEKVTASGTAQS